MRRLALAAVVGLAGCVEQEPPAPTPAYDMNDPNQRCMAGADALGDPWLNDYQKQVILERMRSWRCMG